MSELSHVSLIQILISVEHNADYDCEESVQAFVDGGDLERAIVKYAADECGKLVRVTSTDVAILDERLADDQPKEET